MSHFCQCPHNPIEHLDLYGAHANNNARGIIAHPNSASILHSFIGTKQRFVSANLIQARRIEDPLGIISSTSNKGNKNITIIRTIFGGYKDSTTGFTFILVPLLLVLQFVTVLNYMVRLLAVFAKQFIGWPP
jgi:hypothetical protein